MGFESQAYSRVTEAPTDFAALALRTVFTPWGSIKID